MALWVIASLAIGFVLSWLSRRLLGRLTSRTENSWDDKIVARLGGPLTIGWATTVAYLGLVWLDIAPAADESARRVLKGIFVATLFWVFLRSIDVADQFVAASPWAAKRAASRSLVGLAARTLKVAVVIVAGVTLLAQAGYPVASLIAGLGIGGLALALGAQKTLENSSARSRWRGSAVSRRRLRQDRRFRGDGRAIGLRSTRFRTLDRTIVTIPNGKLADMWPESFTARDRMRLAWMIGLVYQTTAAQMREVLIGFERVPRSHARIWPDAMVVRFSELAASSLNIEVDGLVPPGLDRVPTDSAGDPAQLHGGRRASGTSFAFPTRTVHVVQEPADDPGDEAHSPVGLAP